MYPANEVLILLRLHLFVTSRVVTIKSSNSLLAVIISPCHTHYHSVALAASEVYICALHLHRTWLHYVHRQFNEACRTSRQDTSCELAAPRQSQKDREVCQPEQDLPGSSGIGFLVASARDTPRWVPRG